MKLEYEFTTDTVNFMLEVLNNTSFSGIRNAQRILLLVEQLKAPKNQEALDKQAFEALKSKLDKTSEIQEPEIVTAENA
jgi:hypothetical protein